MKLFVDDIRTVTMSHNLEKGLGVVNDFVIVRDDKSFMEAVDKNFDKIELVSFDHDLALVNENGDEFTGKKACEYIIDKCLDTGKKFPDWYAHSDNTCGRENIIKLIVNFMDKVEGVDVSGYRYFHKGYINGKFVE